MTNQLQPDKKKPSYRTTADAALLATWKRFVEYDNASRSLKRLHSQTRVWIIAMIFAASTIAVLTTFQHANIEILGWQVSETFADIDGALRLALIIVPLIAAGVMTFAYQFSPSQSWIAYRVGAEHIRKNIYLYRLQGGDYANKTPFEQQDLLLQNVRIASQQVMNLGASTPFMKSLKNEQLVDLIPTLTNAPSNDDGFSPMAVDEYIQHRVIHQRDWYVDRTTKDFRHLRRWRVVIILITVASSALAALGGALAPLVAITTAMSVAATMFIDLKMFGRTYSIYHLAADRSGSEMERWQIKPIEKQRDPQEIAKFVASIEQIFQEERDAWMQQAMQAATAAEQALMKSLGRDTDSFSGENGQEDEAPHAEEREPAAVR